MNELMAFSFGDKLVRSVEHNGSPWFIAVDVCKCLELNQVTNALLSLDDDEAALSTVKVRSSNGTLQKREMNIVNESGLYSLIFKSRKESARQFQKWVTSEVLPSIRKTGTYGRALPKSTDFLVLARLIDSLLVTFNAEARGLKIQAIQQLCDLYGFFQPDFSRMGYSVDQMPVH